MTKQQVETLRQSIDDCDQQLLHLLNQRQSLVERLVQHKCDSGDAIFVPERESRLLKRLSEQAQALNLDEALVRDIMQRILRDSYTRQAKMRYPMVTDQRKHIVVVGGKGQLGTLFVELFQRSGHQVSIIDRADWNQQSAVFTQADVVLIAVPISVTEQVIEQLPPLAHHTILADITSIKRAPIEAMMRVHQGPVIGLHPMFGPGLHHLARQLVLYSFGRNSSECEWLLKQISVWGCRLQSVDAAEHDEAMSLVQALRHFVTFVAGKHLVDESIDLEQLMSLSSPIYQMELILIGRMFAQNPELYVDILLNSSYGVGVLERFAACFNATLDALKNKDREALLAEFQRIAQAFQSTERAYVEQSDQLIDAFRERL